MQPASVHLDIEAELKAPGARVQLVHYPFSDPRDDTLHLDGRFRVELCFNSRHRSMRACFRDFWGAERFERVGAAFIVPPDLDVLTRSDEHNPLTSVVCEFDAEPLLQMFDRLPEPTDQLLMESLDIRDPNVTGLLRRLAMEARYPGFASELLTSSMTTQLSIELFRHGVTLIKQPCQGGLAPWRLRRIEERLREARETPTLEELAQLCHISISQLTRGFRASRGCTLGAYVAQSQLEHAKQMLLSGERVGAIAAKLGFSSSSNFCFAFRRVVGVTPGEFQASQANLSIAVTNRSTVQ